MRNLRRIEQCFHSNKEVEELQKLQLQRHQKNLDKYQNVSARINTSHREKKQEKNIADAGMDNKADANANDKSEESQRLHRKSSAPVLNKSCSAKKLVNSSVNGNVKLRKRERKGFSKPTQKLHGKFCSDPNFSHREVDDSDVHSKPGTKYKSQGIQTLDTNQIDDLYSEGMIRYPSKKCLKNSENKDNLDKVDAGAKDIVNASDRGDMQTPQTTYQNGSSDSPELNEPSVPVKGEVDFIKLNKERTSAASRMTTHSNNAAPPSNYRKGVVPKYIRDRKEAQEKEQKAKAEAFDPDCPDGHVPLPDNERKETLRMLKKNYQDYVNELNKLPIKTDTLRAQRKKIEIEKQLNKLEEGIKVFSRPKVYVKVDA